MKRIIYLLTVLALILTFSGCTRKEIKDDNQLNIVTSFYPIFIATSNIIDGAEDVKLTNLTQTSVGCLHDYQLTTKDMNILERADVFVVNGGGMESFIDKAMKNYPELSIINSSEGIIEQDIDESNSEHNHEHEENSHIWVSISMYIEQVKNIAESLGKIDTKNSEEYIQNAKIYIDKLEVLKQEMHETIDDLPNRNIVTFHEAFEFFAEEFDLNIVAVIEREPGTSPSAGELAKIIETIKNTNATAIFIEPQYDAGIANVIAKETKIPVYTLDPIVTGTLGKDSYEKIMRQNLSVLKEALK